MIDLFLREPFFVRVLVTVYLLWLVATVVFTFAWSLTNPVGLSDAQSREVTTKVIGKSKFWYLNMWSRRTKGVWFIVTLLLSVVCCLSLFIKDLAAR